MYAICYYDIISWIKSKERSRFGSELTLNWVHRVLMAHRTHLYWRKEQNQTLVIHLLADIRQIESVGQWFEDRHRTNPIKPSLARHNQSHLQLTVNGDRPTRASWVISLKLRGNLNSWEENKRNQTYKQKRLHESVFETHWTYIMFRVKYSI